MKHTQAQWDFNGENVHLRNPMYLRNTHNRGELLGQRRKDRAENEIGGTSSLDEVRFWECARRRWRGSRRVKE